jgi:hypothetical protein
LELGLTLPLAFPFLDSSVFANFIGYCASARADCAANESAFSPAEQRSGYGAASR